MFVSLLLAEESVDLQDVQPPDVLFHMVRQVVADLREAGFRVGWERFIQFFRDLGEVLNTEVELRNVEIGADPVKFGLVLKDVPRLRPVLRRLLEERLSNIYDLMNEEVLKPARSWLRDRGYDDILILVDQLDRIPQKVINDRGLTNHENIFLDNSAILRALTCDVMYTIPIELADSLVGYACSRRTEAPYCRSP